MLLSLWLAFSLRLGIWFWPNTNQTWLFTTIPFLAIPIFIKFGFYHMVVRYMGQKSTLAITQASGVLVLLWLLTAITLLPIPFGSESGLPRSIPILLWMILALTISGSRQVVRWMLQIPVKNQPNRSVLIYGASRLGSELALSLSHDKDVRVLGFIDDDHTLHDHNIQNLKVLGDRTQIAKIRATTSPLDILLTMPNIDIEQRKALFKYLEDKKVTVKIVPSLRELASQDTIKKDLRNVVITDLLARKEIAPNAQLLNACITGKNIMVTGAGGSIGSELCRQILSLNPACIILFEHSEFNLYKINNELISLCKNTKKNVEIVPVLGSINNKQRVENTIKDFKINTLYHAAAYKHVTLLEGNIGEGILNNIFGTLNVAQIALDLNVEHFILISTDKAVRPTSIMGATKRIAELIIQGLSQKAQSEKTNSKYFTRFAIVRFGNVLGSSGSVIPLFQQQIAYGGPITITHPEVTRYFMTISEASQLVIQAGSLGKNCNIFVLNMGEPVSILSLAKQLVYLSGHMLKTDNIKPDEPGIEIQYTGLQKGEKIHEELFIGKNITNTEHPLIMEAQEIFHRWSKVEEILTQLDPQKNLSNEKLQQLLMQYALPENEC